MSVAINDVTLVIRLILDILVVWCLLYFALRMLRNNTRTVQILKGILIIIVVKGLSVWFGLNAFSYIMNIFLQWGVLALIILFQPEIRGVLEKIGKTSPVSMSNLTREESMSMIDELIEACNKMSKSKTGALITIERTQKLTDYIATGIRMNSVVSSELLGTIFQYGTPMHDGAVIIRGNEIACAAAYFPPTTKDLPSKYGARHRAAVGISEITDSITIVVSEETGNISLAVKGQLTQYPIEGLKRYLTNVLVPAKETTDNNPNGFIKTVRSIPRVRAKRQDRNTKKKDERIQPIEIVDLYNGKEADSNGKK